MNKLEELKYHVSEIEVSEDNSDLFHDISLTNFNFFDYNSDYSYVKHILVPSTSQNDYRPCFSSNSGDLVLFGRSLVIINKNLDYFKKFFFIVRRIFGNFPRFSKEIFDFINTFFCNALKIVKVASFSKDVTTGINCRIVDGLMRNLEFSVNFPLIVLKLSHDDHEIEKKSLEKGKKVSWADEMNEINEYETIHDESCDEHDHSIAYDIIKTNVVNDISSMIFMQNINNQKNEFNMDVFFQELENEILKDYKIDNVKVVTAEFMYCDCENFCTHKNIFKKDTFKKDYIEPKIVVSDFKDEIISKKYYYISHYSHLLNPNDIRECFDNDLEFTLEKLKSTGKFDDYLEPISNRSLFSSKYFDVTSESNEIRFVFDTNIFISHLILPYDIPIKFSKTVMFEMIKLKKHANAYKRFFRFFFSSPNVKFPETKFKDLKPVFYDDELIKEVSDNDILVTNDAELRSRIPKKSMSYSNFVTQIRPKRLFSTLPLSPKACVFFLDTYNWSVKQPNIVENIFHFSPVIPEKNKNSIMNLNYDYETLIDIPVELEDFSIDMQMPIIEDHEPLCDISNIDQFSSNDIDDIYYEFPYEETKNSKISIENYKSFLNGFEDKHNTDEIFPLTSSQSSVLNEFVHSANLMEMTRIKKRGTNIFRNSMELQYRFEKESNEDKIKCVKSSERLENFIETNSESFLEKKFLMVDSPKVEGPFEIDFKETFMSFPVRSCNLLSKLFEDLIYQLSVKIKSNEIIVRDNGLPFGFILYPGRTEKRFKTIRSYRLFFRNDSIGCWSPEVSYGNFSVSKCYTESIEDIKYKSDLFKNLAPIYLRNLMSESDFVLTYFHMFWSNSSSKKQLGFLKFYTVISESKFSNITNLVDKYLMNPYKREVHFMFQKKMYNMIEMNMVNSFSTIFRENNDDIYDFIDTNSIFVYNKKTGQNRFHSFKQFVTDIDKNCDEFEKKFNGIYYKSEKNLKGKFLLLPALKESFKIFKRKLSDRNVKAEDILEQTKKYIVEDFGVFKSSNGSLDINDEFKKKKCIETYLSELETQDDFIDEIHFIKNCLYKKGDERLTGLSKKPQAEGTNREIYITNIKRRSQLFIIQSFFKVLCKYSHIDMVVESQFDKFQLIQDSSSSDSHKSFLNADMGKWSPQDVVEKFDYALEILIELDIVPVEIINLLRKCMKNVKDFIIIIPQDFSESDFYKSFKNSSNRSFEKFKFEKNIYETMSFDFGWPQGMFHNVSSFIHSCSCDLADQMIKSKINSVISNKFFVSSDDKNLVTTYSQEPSSDTLRKILEITDKVSSAFALESSKTKNSISTKLTEMISVINYNGTIVYSPMKSLANMSTSLDEVCFIKNHKSILSRVCSFFGMSNRYELSEKIYEYYFKILCEHYNVSQDQIAPISCFGKKLCSVIEYHKKSENYDNLAKYIKHPQLVYDYLTNRKNMKVLDNFNSKRIDNLLDRKRGLIDHYKNESNKSQFNIDMNFILGMEYASIKSGKKRMFLNKSDASFNSYYYKSRKPSYLFGNDKVNASVASVRLSRPCGIIHEMSNLIYRTRDVVNEFLRIRNNLVTYEKQYKPSGKLHYVKQNSYENITNSFNEVLMFIKNPIGVSKNPYYSRKISSLIRDTKNVMKSLNITTVEEFESSRENFEELKERYKSNLYYRLQHNGEWETLDYLFKNKFMDIIDANFVVESLEFKSEINKSSKIFKSNLKQIFNTLCFDVKVMKLDPQEALNKAQYVYSQMSKGYRIEQIESYISDMSDVYQLFNLNTYPGLTTKFSNKGKTRLEYENINDKITIVKVKRGLKDIDVGIIDEHRKVMFFEKENKLTSKILRINDVIFQINKEEFDYLSKGFEKFTVLNESSLKVNNLEVRVEKKLFLEFFTDKGLIKKLIPISKVRKEDVTVQYKSLQDYLVTIQKLGNICIIKGNNIEGDTDVSLNFSMRTKLKLEEKEKYKKAIEDEFGINCYFCKHLKDCFFDNIKDNKYIKVCSQSFKWEFWNDGEKLDEMKSKSTEVVKKVMSDLDDFDTSEALEEIYCICKRFMNGKDIFNIFNERLTQRDSILISRAVRKNLLTNKMNIPNSYYYDNETKSVSFFDGDDYKLMKPMETYKSVFFKSNEKIKNLLKNIPEKFKEKISEVQEIIPEKYNKIRNKYYEFLNLKKEKENSNTGKVIEIIDDIEPLKKYRSFMDQFEESDEDYENAKETYDKFSKLFDNSIDKQHLETMIGDDEELLYILDYETNLFKQEKHTEECDEDFCECKYESFEKFTNGNFDDMSDEQKYNEINKFLNESVLNHSYIYDSFDMDSINEIFKKTEKIKVSCQCNDNFECGCEIINNSENIVELLSDLRKENFEQFNHVSDKMEEEKVKKIFYNDEYIFLPIIEANYRDPKTSNKDLYIDNEFSFQESKIMLSDIFKGIDIQMSEVMEEEELEKAIIEKKNEELEELNENVLETYEFKYYIDIEKHKNLDFKSKDSLKLDNRSERILKNSPEIVNDSIKIFGFEPQSVYEKKKHLTKFNTNTESTLSGYRTTDSSIFEESKKYDDIELDCSKETCLKAYVTYVYLYKRLLNTSDNNKKRLIGIKNSLNLYLSLNKDNVEMNNIQAFSYVFNNIDENVNKSSGFLKSLIGESLVDMSSIEYIFQKIGKMDKLI